MIKVKSNFVKKIEQDIRSRRNITSVIEEVKMKGSPIIELNDCINAKCLVTFMYIEEEAIENVTVYGFGVGFDCSANVYEKIPNSPIWYRTFLLDYDIEFAYSLSVNDSLEKNCKERYAKLMMDPLNKTPKVMIHKDPEDNNRPNVIMSYVKMPMLKVKKWDCERNEVPKGDIHKVTFDSKILGNSRRIWIYTPFGFNKESIDNNLLILNDGCISTYTLNAQVILDNLLYERRIESFIGVFIDSTSDRFKEYQCSDSYNNFIIDEILPYIRKEFNITNDPKGLVIGGFSLGALASLYTGFKHSDTIGKVVAQSCSLREMFPQAIELIEEIKKSKKIPLDVYINMGKLENVVLNTDVSDLDRAKELYRIFHSKGYDVYFEEFMSGHDYLNWGECLGNAMDLLYN